MKRYRPAVTFLVVGLGLSAGFFPNYYNTITSYDDEGSVLVVIQRFLHHGSLYNHTHGGYGPFYYSLAGLIYRGIGQSPTLFTGRLIVLVITMLSVIGFAAAVWKVTRSVTLGVLCEVATFIVLIPIAGAQPMHPGSMIVLLLAVLSYAFAGYAMERRTVYLVVSGAAMGALLMTKINVGLLAVAAVMIGFVSGNVRYPRWFRIAVAIAALALPFAITSQLLYQMFTAQFAVLVSFSLLLTLVTLHADEVSLPPRALLVIGEGLAATVVVSCIWPLATGTSLRRLFVGVLIQPLGQTEHLAFPVRSHILWITIVLTVVGAGAVRARSRAVPLNVRPPWLLDAALALAGASVLGLGLFEGIAAWLPAIALLPALAFLADVPRKVRVALRLLVPFVILQMMHAYPVPGAQLAWGLVAMVVPCVIALAAGLKRLQVWRSAQAPTRVIAVGSLCAMVVLTAGLWPGAIWNKYLKAEPLDLRGARLVRVDAETKAVLQRLTQFVRKNCDTFYSAPAFDALYIYTGLPIPTGQLANWPGVLKDWEQRELAAQLAAADARGRVCIVRDLRRDHDWKASSYGKGPLGRALAPYRRRIALIGRYSVSLKGRAPRSRPITKPRAGGKRPGAART